MSLYLLLVLFLRYTYSLTSETLEFNPQTFQLDGFVNLNEKLGCNIVPVKHTEMESDLQSGEEIVPSEASRILREENSVNFKENENRTPIGSFPPLPRNKILFNN